ncbi:hypothetical protein P4H42_26655 [Paenibacillus macerans]|nr:hypothetical protein [Paenibacillus macerans]MEC0333156.1 hypothetical protein [Paenibacillus macerans]MED4956976.1 hypothetical protein [Paenibacillus macerans]
MLPDEMKFIACAFTAHFCPPDSKKVLAGGQGLGDGLFVNVPLFSS